MDETINIKFGSLLAPISLIIISIVAIIVMIVNIWSVNKCSREAVDLRSNNNWIIGINVVVILASIVTLIIGIYAAAKASGVDKTVKSAYRRIRTDPSLGSVSSVL